MLLFNGVPFRKALVKCIAPLLVVYSQSNEFVFPSEGKLRQPKVGKSYEAVALEGCWWAIYSKKYLGVFL